MKYIPFLMAIALISCSSNEKKTEKEAVASKAVSEIHSPGEKVSGSVKIQDMGDHFKINAEISGLKPNSKHGFHIHQNGICEGPDYQSAGGHLNPYNKPHGAPKEKKSHLGDMGNLEANAKGLAKKEIVIPKEHEDAMEKIIGKAFIVHSKADDLKSQPSGDAGSRIACGIIQSEN